jgi:hypothetical protein
VRRHLLLLSAALAVAVAATPPRAEEKRAVRVEKVEYAGWKNNLKISNGTVELIVTLDVGPRVISYKRTGGQNVFKEFPDQLGKSDELTWVPRGGHRLWTSPEDLTRTYAPDNEPVQYELIKAEPAHEADAKGAPVSDPNVVGVKLIQRLDDRYGIQKGMDIRLAPTGSRVRVTHHIWCSGSEPAKLAPWALTILDAGGVEVIPLPPKRPHPGPPQHANAPSDYAPNQKLVLWPFTDLADPRYTWGSKYILLRQDAQRGPTKIGLAHRMGWVGYLNRGTLFVKHFEPPSPDKTYPDGGCNFETFTNQDMLEVETLGPLVTVGPNEVVEHVEHWELFDGVGEVKTEADVDARVLPKIGK